LAQANQARVLNSLADKFGDKAEARFTEQADALGVSVGFLSDLARKAPEAVLAYFPGTSTPDTNPTQGSINTQVLDSTPPPADESHLRWLKPQLSDQLQKWRAVAKS
jgi:hypothetical protein